MSSRAVIALRARKGWRDLIGCARLESNISFGASGDEVADIIERNLDKSPKRAGDEQPLLLTTRREALSLYREIMRITALFDWPDEWGRLWRDVLRESARKEFEAARFERDPEQITRMLVVGRDAVHQVAERFVAKRQEMTGGAAGRGPGHPPSGPFSSGGGGGSGSSGTPPF